MNFFFQILILLHFDIQNQRTAPSEITKILPLVMRVIQRKFIYFTGVTIYKSLQQHFLPEMNNPSPTKNFLSPMLLFPVKSLITYNPIIAINMEMTGIRN